MKSVLGIGNALVDILATLPSDELLDKYCLPKGSMRHVDEIISNNILKELLNIGCQRVAGGSSANTINGLAMLGTKTGFIGKVGADKLGEDFRIDQESSGIHSNLLTDDVSSGRAMVLISSDVERTFAVYLGAAIELDSTDLTTAMFEGYSHFHIEGYLVQNHRLFEKAVELAKLNGMTVSLDMASYNVVDENKEFLGRMLEHYVDIVFANEDEAMSFTGLEPDKAVSRFAELCDIAVVKIGKEGSLIKSKQEFHRINAIAANAVDATGAGDLYASGFLYGLSNGLSLDKCGAIGSLCAGKVVEVIGTKMSDITWKLIQEKIKEIETK
ncbi:MAG: adenosine kinase [Prevotellaceae bacterium]|jgi:sugar/nucleoside kinase (ribokinase family)|nr:adenosine kinase [Prevotellaceae bacterium]